MAAVQVLAVTAVAAIPAVAAVVAILPAAVAPVAIQVLAAVLAAIQVLAVAVPALAAVPAAIAPAAVLALAAIRPAAVLAAIVLAVPALVVPKDIRLLEAVKILHIIVPTIVFVLILAAFPRRFAAVVVPRPKVVVKAFAAVLLVVMLLATVSALRVVPQVWLLHLLAAMHVPVTLAPCLLPDALCILLPISGILAIMALSTATCFIGIRSPRVLTTGLDSGSTATTTGMTTTFPTSL